MALVALLVVGVLLVVGTLGLADGLGLISCALAVGLASLW